MEKDEYIIMHEVEQTHWWFAGRRFLIHKMLSGLLPSQHTGNIILDMGCGTGTNHPALQSYGNVYGLDLSFEALRLSRKRGMHRLTRADFDRDLPFRDNTFHAITCLDVLEHLNNDHRAIREIFRICRPGGYVIITVPAFNVQWSAHDVALHHKRRYTKQQLLKKAAGYPWKVVRSSYYNTTLFLPILVARKIKGLFTKEETVSKSDCSIPTSKGLNSFLKIILKTEISCLDTFSLPFGVSLFLLLQKDHA